MKIIGIYKITTISNGKIYVGSSLNVRARWCQHLYKLRRNIHCNQHLQNVFNKYGEVDLKFELLEQVSLGLLLEYEQKWINLLNSLNKRIGYNQAPVAGTTRGVRQNERQKIQASLRMLGNSYAKGRKNSPEQLATLKKIASEKPLSEKQLIRYNNLSIQMKGNSNTLGLKHTKDAKERIRNARKGVPKSAETREKMRLASIKREANKREIVPYIEPEWLTNWKKKHAN